MYKKLLSIIQNPNATFIVSARGISDFGAYLNMVALSTYVYLITNNIMFVGIFFACRVFGGIIASLIGTKFFRKFYGNYSLIMFDVLRATLLSLLLFLSTSNQIKVIPFIAFGLGLSNSMFSIGLNSQLPCWIEEKIIVSTNSWITSISATAIMLGTFLSGILISLNGYKMVFEVNICCYLLAAILIMPLRMKSLPKNKSTNNNTAKKKAWFHDLQKIPILCLILIINLADTFGSSAHNVGLPVLSKLISPINSAKTMGIILAVWAMGKFLGARLTNLILRKNSLQVTEKMFFSGVFVMSTGFILLFQQSSFSILLVLCAIYAGIGDGIAEVSLVSRIQNETEELRLPLFSLLTFLQMTGFGLGMLIVSPFYIWWKPSHVIILFHGIPLLAIIASLIFIKIRKYHSKSICNSSFK